MLKEIMIYQLNSCFTCHMFCLVWIPSWYNNDELFGLRNMHTWYANQRRNVNLIKGQAKTEFISSLLLDVTFITFGFGKEIINL